MSSELCTAHKRRRKSYATLGVLQEHSYFAFGGSTVLVLFQKGRIEFDTDLVENSNLRTETKMQMGMSLGRCAERWVRPSVG